jgi:hypothetical protein
MLNVERLEAVGSRGEACIIVRTATDVTATGGGTDEATYRLATGEQLRQTSDPAVFETRDGRRQFTLRVGGTVLPARGSGRDDADGFAASQFPEPQE